MHLTLNHCHAEPAQINKAEGSPKQEAKRGKADAPAVTASPASFTSMIGSTSMHGM